MDQRAERCDRCRFWEEVPDDFTFEDDREGYCHRHAPAPALQPLEEDYYRPSAPLTHADFWCGEFIPRKDPPPFPAREE